ncbi:MAG: UDP-N-acetylmuramoyl-L-alanine--D-glutamate ligase [Clostridia bacterium]|nr:UDP-N-acetylmuramoyl-L-alanine--D-glutamate ligase [Clostridia bacterium]
MLTLGNKSFALAGLGVSNRAVIEYLEKYKIPFKVYLSKKEEIQNYKDAIYCESDFNIDADIIFRSPAIRPEKIKGNGQIFTEIGFSLENISCYKIGITGSDGKTTTSTLIYEMLRDKFPSYLSGNIGIPLITKIDDITKNSYVVCELSSFQLFDYSPSLDCAVVTSISENHLDWHKSLLEYIYAKRNILKRAKRAVLCYDCEYRCFFTGDNLTYYSLKDLSSLCGNGSHYVYLKNDIIFYDDKPLFKKQCVKLTGEYNLKNLMAAIGVCYPLIDIERIKSVAMTFKGVSHRCERVAELNGVTFIDSSIDSTPQRAISTLSAFPSGKTIAIMGGYDKNLSYHVLKNTLRDLKGVIIFGQNRNKLIEASPKGARVVNTMKEAVNLAYKMSRSGDFIVLSPASASFDMYKNYKEKSDAFIKEIGALDGKD